MTRTLTTLAALALAAWLSRELRFSWWQIVTGLIWTGVAVGLVPGVTAARFGRVVEREDAQR